MIAQLRRGNIIELQVEINDLSSLVVRGGSESSGAIHHRFRPCTGTTCYSWSRRVSHLWVMARLTQSDGYYGGNTKFPDHTKIPRGAMGAQVKRMERAFGRENARRINHRVFRCGLPHGCDAPDSSQSSDIHQKQPQPPSPSSHGKSFIVRWRQSLKDHVWSP